MTKSNYFYAICAALIVVLGTYDLLHLLKIFSLPMKLFVLINYVIPFLFLIGGWMVTSANNKEPHVQINKFVLLTTFQFMTMLMVIAAVWYKFHFALKPFGLQIVSIYVLLMFFQSWLILKSVNKE